MGKDNEKTEPCAKHFKELLRIEDKQNDELFSKESTTYQIPHQILTTLTEQKIDGVTKHLVKNKSPGKGDNRSNVKFLLLNKVKAPRFESTYAEGRTFTMQ